MRSKIRNKVGWEKGEWSIGIKAYGLLIEGRAEDDWGSIPGYVEWGHIDLAARLWSDWGESYTGMTCIFGSGPVKCIVSIPPKMTAPQNVRRVRTHKRSLLGLLICWNTSNRQRGDIDLWYIGSSQRSQGPMRSPAIDDSIHCKSVSQHLEANYIAKLMRFSWKGEKLDHKASPAGLVRMGICVQDMRSWRV
jgi:hypothetical protein